MKWWIAAVGLWASVASAQTVVKPVGMRVTLSAAQSSSAASTNAIDASRGYDTLLLFSTGTLGGSTQTLQISCDNGTSWVAYPGPLTITALPGVITLADPPPCLYRTNITSCTGCSITTTAFVVGAK